MPRRRRNVTVAAVPNKHKFTDLSVKKLAPQDRPYLVWDTHQRGLALQVQPTGRKSWKVIYRSAADLVGTTSVRLTRLVCPTPASWRVV